MRTIGENRRDIRSISWDRARKGWGIRDPVGTIEHGNHLIWISAKADNAYAMELLSGEGSWTPAWGLRIMPEWVVR